ncbi:hypothetical protein HK405_002852, partial [Cladochytrium tenue]
CGHEYTLANLRFAAHVDGANPAVASKLAWAQRTACTVPSTIAAEREHNPFMRVENPRVAQAAMAADVPGPPAPEGGAVEVMRRLREMKNAFRGPSHLKLSQ